MSSDNRLALPLGTMLNQYRIDAILGHGGFGIVYKATHIDLDLQVAIKEYLPQELATREASTVHPISSQDKTNFQEGLDRFLQEAKKLVQFESHPNIVRCRDFFRANGTAYLVMDFEDGLPLSELLKQYESKNKKLSEQQILELILPLLDGLKTIHEAGVLHRDIKPGNIFIRRSDQQPVLIDFGAAKQNFSQHSKSMAPYSPGYAAIEQIEEEGNLGPWTDIYAIGAVMWRIVAGRNPPQVEKRTNAVVRGTPDPMQLAAQVCHAKYSDKLAATIDRCISLREKDRFQCATEVLSVLKNQDQSDQPLKKPVNSIVHLAPENSIKKVFSQAFAGFNSKTYMLPITVIGVLTVLGLGSWWWQSQSSSLNRNALPQPTVTETSSNLAEPDSQINPPQTPAQSNAKEGEAFLRANSEKAGVVALPSGLQYRVVKQGTGPKPTIEDNVTVNYRGRLIDGTEFDSSHKRNQAATFPLNAVIRGWVEGLQLMAEGSTFELFIPADLAYGARGNNPPIGPNETLVFEVELIKVTSR